MAQRFILSFQGRTMPDRDVSRICGLTGISILDISPDPMLVVNVEQEEPLRELINSMPNWIMAPEAIIEVMSLNPYPDT